MPSHATSVFEEGLMVPPIRLWDAGCPPPILRNLADTPQRMAELDSNEASSR